MIKLQKMLIRLIFSCIALIAALTAISTVAGAAVLLETGIVSGVSNSQWSTVFLNSHYSSMVVICSPNYDASYPPLIVRIRNAVDNKFELLVDRLDNSSAPFTGVSVHYLVVEEGSYNEIEDGITMEAVKFTSTLTDNSYSWVGEARSYSNTYTNPVVIGQVMSYNDPGVSIFWSHGPSAKDPPSASTLFVGKHVGEDSDKTRANETVGYLVIEAGSGFLGSMPYLAGLGQDMIRGTDNGPPYSYQITGLPDVSTAIVSLAGMDGVNGGWAYLYGSDPLTTSSLALAVDEDQLRDSERSHSDEQVAYLIFGPAAANAPPLADNQNIVIEEDFPAEITLTASDPDNDPLSYNN